MGADRLVPQRLIGDQAADPVELVRWMGALQAQDYGQSLWAIGSRLRHGTKSAVEEAIRAGDIVRTWPMRGTLHWVPAADAAWMVRLSAERTLAASRTRRAQLDLDSATIAHAGDLLAAALTGGRRLARPDVMQLWTDAGISVDGQRGYHLLWHLAHDGLIVVGPMAGRQQTFLLLGELPGQHLLSTGESLVELARRYARSHQPIRVADFAWWAGLKITDARRGVAAAGLNGAVGETGAGADRVLWTAGAADPTDPTLDEAESRSGVQLLAGFDEFLLGYQQRSDVLDPAFANRVVPGNNGIFQPCVVVDGRVVGTWRRSVRNGSVNVAVQPFTARSIPTAALHEAAAGFAAFHEVRLGRVTVEL